MSCLSVIISSASCSVKTTHKPFVNMSVSNAAASHLMLVCLVSNMFSKQSCSNQVICYNDNH